MVFRSFPKNTSTTKLDYKKYKKNTIFSVRLVFLHIFEKFRARFLKSKSIKKLIFRQSF